MYQPAEAKQNPFGPPSEFISSLLAASHSLFQPPFLISLPSSPPRRSQVLHNLAIAQYHQEGKKHGLRLLHALQGLSGADLDSSNADSKFARPDCLARYNCAVVLYQARSFDRALDVANALFDGANGLPHWLAVRTGLLVSELGTIQIILVLLKQIRSVVFHESNSSLLSPFRFESCSRDWRIEFSD